MLFPSAPALEDENYGKRGDAAVQAELRKAQGALARLEAEEGREEL